jgi:hypothetical protein
VDPGTGLLFFSSEVGETSHRFLQMNDGSSKAINGGDSIGLFLT